MDEEDEDDDDGDEVRVLLPGVGQPVPGHVIKAGLGAVCQQQLTQVPVTLHHNTFVPEMKHFSRRIRRREKLLLALKDMEPLCTHGTSFLWIV